MPPNSEFTSMLTMQSMNNSRCRNGSAGPTIEATAFSVVEELREIWMKLNGTLVREQFNPLITEFVDLTYKEFQKPDAWARPFSV